MFFQQFDQKMVEMSKFFKMKRTVYETATFFDQLGAAQSTDNPFEVALAALAKFGELQCYSKVEDTSRTIQTAVSAARLFIQNAKFGFEYSRNIQETWYSPLCDGLHCYRVAIDLLKENKKPYLAATILSELGKTEMEFELVHPAANTYEEAINVIIDGKAPLQLLFNTTLACLNAYAKVDRFDLALNAVERAQSHFFDNETMWASPSPIMKRQYRDILIDKSILLLMVFKYDECVSFSEKHLEVVEADIFKRLSEASKGNQVYVIDKLLEEAKSSKKFNNSQINLLGRHLTLVSKAVETGVFQVMSN